MTKVDLNWLATELLPAVHGAGRVIMNHFQVGVAVEYKSDASPVTAADREAEDLILSTLVRSLPDIPVISEEASARGSTPLVSELFFLVDPLDGTKEFINRDGDFTVNIGLIDRTRPCFGMVYAPAHGEFYATLSDMSSVFAKLDPSAPTPSLNELEFTELHTREPPDDNLTAVTSRSHLDAETKRFLRDHNITRTQSAGSSLKFCLLARAGADVYPRLAPTMEWDTAAGDAVLRGAGGVVLDKTGALLAYGKRDRAYRNPNFIAWGRAPNPRPPSI